MHIVKTRILAALFVIGLVGAWAPSASAQVNALAARKTADQGSSSTTFADVTGLTWYVAANTNYAFVCDLSYTTGNATVALQLAVNGPASPTAVRYGVTTATGAAAVHFASQSAYDTNTNPAASGGATALPATISGVIENGATAGTVAIRFRSQTSGTTVTVLRGSSCTVYR